MAYSFLEKKSFPGNQKKLIFWKKANTSFRASDSQVQILVRAFIFNFMKDVHKVFIGTFLPRTMENKQVGLLIIGIAIVMAIVVFIFSSALQGIITATCSHGPTCSMNSTLKMQTWISVSLVFLVLIIGLVIMFSKPSEKIIVKKVKERIQKKKLDLSGLDKDEKKVIGILQRENGTMFQATLTEELGAGKVKITRILDKLEAKQLIERKRRGMNNVVVLKNN